jgi:hypothetical protein
MEIYLKKIGEGFEAWIKLDLEEDINRETHLWIS